MARRVKSYFEPLMTTRSPSWDAAYRGSPPPVGETDSDERRQAALDWEAKKAKAEKDADWIILGSNMAEPAIVVGLTGTPVYMDDRRILTFSRLLGLPEGTVTHKEFAQRVVACINGCEGIADPVRFVAEVRTLLLEYARGEGLADPREDSRVISLLSRCIPPEELQEVSTCHEES